MKRVLVCAVFALGILVALATFGFCLLFSEDSLTVRNETATGVVIQVDTWGAMDVPAGGERTLKLDGVADPHIVYVFGPTYYECLWSDAKNHEPLVVSETGVNCSNRVEP